MSLIFFLSYRMNFLEIQKRAEITHGKRAIDVQIIDVILEFIELRGMASLGRLSAILYKGDNFCYFLFVFPYPKFLPKRNLQWTLVTTTAFVPEDVAIIMNLLL